MMHTASKRFWQCLDALPAEIQTVAHRNFAQLKANPSRPSLHFKTVGNGRFHSVRVGLYYRALGLSVPGGVHWFWVSLNLLWAIEAALCGESWQTVAREHRTSLLLALDAQENDRSKMPGTTTLAAEVTHVSKHGFWLLLADEELLVPFDQFPWFRKGTIEQISDVQWPPPDHLASGRARGWPRSWAARPI